MTWRVPGFAVGAAAAAGALIVPGLARAQELESLRTMSIEDLAEVNVSSVSKTDQPLADAAASIYVITREDIIRSGATTIPEMLRLAPNLQVYQKNSLRLGGHRARPER